MGINKKKSRKRCVAQHQWMVMMPVLFLIALMTVAVVSGIIVGFNRDEKMVIPEIVIKLNDTTLDGINSGSKTMKYYGNEMTLRRGEEKLFYNDVEIKGRGNASWAMDKKSYRIKFDEKVDLLGLGKMKKWALVSNHLDDSLVRNDLGQYLASLLYENYPIKGDFVKLKIDDENLGLYYLIKPIEISKNSVEIKRLDAIIVELDNAYCESNDVRLETKYFHDCIAMKDVRDEETVYETMTALLNDYNSFEKALINREYEKVLEIIDVESWAKYFLLSELTSNPDAYVTSWYLYRDGESDKIHANLGWDFDAAFGNRNWEKWPDEFYSPSGLMNRMEYSFTKNENESQGCRYLIDIESTVISPVMCYLAEMPEFRDLVKEVYRDKIKFQRENIMNYIKTVSSRIHGAAIENDVRWGKNNFLSEIKYLSEWVETRLEYLDQMLGERISLPFSFEML